MARCVFFSFYYRDDIRRVVQVRNAWEFCSGNGTQRIYDRGVWEKVKAGGPDAVRRTIEEGLKGTSVTVVLIGEHTASRPWVQYEIRRTIEQGKGLVGVRIHNLKDPLAARVRVRPSLPPGAEVRLTGLLGGIILQPSQMTPATVRVRAATSKPGKNPLLLKYRCIGKGLVQPSRFYKTYDWMVDDGRKNLGAWVEEAARIAGR